MTEDIVDRLREQVLEDHFECEDCELYSHAADEIERLNALADNLRAEIQYYQSLQRN